MIVHVITLFPEQIEATVSAGVMGKAREKGLLDIRTTQLRDFSEDRHHKVDDYPYGGGGGGLILKPDVAARAIRHVFKENCTRNLFDGIPIVMTTPHGRKLDASVAREYSEIPEWIIFCGHYGGVDQRVTDQWATDEISIGDFVLTGGELASLVIIEAAARFVPGVLGNEASAEGDTFEDGLLGAPLYTRPPDFEGRQTPEILLSGNHAAIDAWRRRKKLELTLERRPDLLQTIPLTEEDRRILDDIKKKK